MGMASEQDKMPCLIFGGETGNLYVEQDPIDFADSLRIKDGPSESPWGGEAGKVARL